MSPTPPAMLFYMLPICNKNAGLTIEEREEK